MMETGDTMKKHHIEQLLLTLILLGAAGISPNLYPAAQAGFARLSTLAKMFLLPSLIVMAGVLWIAYLRGHRTLVKQAMVGIAAGLMGTVGLEIVRHVGFLLGGMPGEMPKLLGVLLLDRFAMGPNWLSNIAGWSYHFWNGASFGLIYAFLAGRGNTWLALGYATLIGIGFMISPAALSLGVGLFGRDFGIGFPLTVMVAHIAFGLILGSLVFRWNTEGQSIFHMLKTVFADDAAYIGKEQ